jgi:hypothetical protein
MAGRIRREFKRQGFNREIQRLFVIAAEEWYQNKAVHIEPLKRLEGGSSPSSVLKQLREFKSEFKLRAGDELWMVIDRDKQSWKIAEISQVAQQCEQASYGFAMTNPAFEFWLLLHIRDMSTYSAEVQQEFLENGKTGDRTRVEQELVTLLGSYNKSNLNVNHYLPQLTVAVERAEAMDHGGGRWPNGLGSHVYKLIKRLLEP